MRPARKLADGVALPKTAILPTKEFPSRKNRRHIICFRKARSLSVGATRSARVNRQIINKLFRRRSRIFIRVVYLLVLDRPIRHLRFCRVDDGAGSGVKRRLWPCRRCFTPPACIFRRSGNVMVGIVPVPAAGLRPLWSLWGVRLPPRCSRWDRKTCMCCRDAG